MRKTRNAIVGTGGGAGMFPKAIMTAFRERAELVALGDIRLATGQPVPLDQLLLLP